MSELSTQERRMRKYHVHDIMYRSNPSASEKEMQAWRQTCAEYIAGMRDTYPETLAQLRNEEMT